MLNSAPKGHDSEAAVILVNWNGWADCIDCLDTLLSAPQGPSHVYLVDNLSSDGSLEKIAAWCARPTRPDNARDLPGLQRLSAAAEPAPIAVRMLDWPVENPPPPAPGCRLSLIQSGANRGFAGGNNVGLKLALAEGASWFWLLNSDTVVRTDTLTRLLERGTASPQIGVVGSTLLYHGNPERVQALCGGAMNPRTFVTWHVGIGSRADDVPEDPAAVEAQITYVVGASMLVSRAFLEQVGLMQEDYFLYGEEIDWAARGRGLFTQAWAPRSVVYHKVGMSTAKVVPGFAMRMMLRNRLRFVARFHPERIGAARRYLWWDWLRHLLKRRFAAAAIVFGVLRERGQGAVEVPR